MCASCYRKWRYATDPAYAAQEKTKKNLYYLNNREKIITQTQIRYRKTHPVSERIREPHQKLDRAAQQREWRRENPELVFEANLRKKYGITGQQYRQMVLDQKGRCALCGKVPSKRGFFVDHNHMTHRMRALICQPCNIRLGIYENKEWMQKALAYLADPPMNNVIAMREEKTTQ